MDRKFFNGLIAGILAGAVISLAALCVVVFLGKGRFVLTDSSNGQTSATATSAEFNSKVASIYSLIDTYFYRDITHEKLEEGMLRGLARSLDDPYAAYFNEEEFAKMQESAHGEYCGIGALVSQDITTKVLTIVKPYIDSPALKAGLLSGDILCEVDGTNIEGQELDDVVSLMKGEENTDVVLGIKREGCEGLLHFTVTRGKIPYVFVRSRMLEDNIGYILISEFEDTTPEQFKKAYDELVSQGMTSLVLDLRDNPGGLYDSVLSMVDMFIDKNQLIVYTEDKNGKTDEEYSKEDRYVDIPTVVLVNENSASASEIFTGTVKHYKAATVIGQKTYGKGIVQYTIGINGNKEAFKLTHAHYFLPDGTCIHGTGIEPDIMVELDEQYRGTLVEQRATDNQLEAAKKQLTNK